MHRVSSLSAVMVAIFASGQPYAGWFPNSINVAQGFRAGLDTKMVCGKISPTTGQGEGYAFNRIQSGPQNIGVTKYQTLSTPGSGSGAGSTLSIAMPDILPRSMYDFTVVGLQPGDTAGRVFLFGGKGGANTFSNDYFSYSPAAGFKTPASNVSPSTTSPNLIGDQMAGGLVTGRAAMQGVAVGASKIILFGGYDSGGMRTEVYEVDVAGTPTWTPKANMPFSLKNAKTLPSGSGGAVHFIYVVGGGTFVGTDSDNRRIFRYDTTSSNADKWFKLQDAAGNDIVIPGTKPVEIASVQGAMLILTQSEDDQSMIAYRLTHPSPISPLGTANVLNVAKGATLVARNYSVPSRARSDFGLLRCSADTWVIGGSTGHGSTFQNRGSYVDKLTRY